MSKKQTKNWLLVGGGTTMFSRSKYPCDDEYENQKTGEIVVFATTMDRHFDMPDRVRRPSDVTRLTGVRRKPIQRYDPKNDRWY